MDEEYGLNIFVTTRDDITASEIVQNWYDEIKQHDFFINKFCEETAHFTQVVWKSTKELGVAIVNNTCGHIFVVAVYYPAGNQKDTFTENVKPTLVSIFLGALTSIAEISRSRESSFLSSTENMSTTKFTQFEEKCLDTHNIYRKLHGAQPLNLNSRLCKKAQRCAIVSLNFFFSITKLRIICDLEK